MKIMLGVVFCILLLSLVYAAEDDFDNDGMPDDWERAHGTRYDVADSELDADNDGISNYDEYLKGEQFSEQKSSVAFSITWRIIVLFILLIALLAVIFWDKIKEKFEGMKRKKLPPLMPRLR